MDDMTPSDKITAVLQGVRELADRATAGLDTSMCSSNFDAWISANYAKNADASNYIVAKRDAGNANQDSPASGEGIIQNCERLRLSETQPEESNETQIGKHAESESNEKETQSTISVNGENEWNGWLPDVSLRIRCAKPSEKWVALASIAENQSELDSIPETQGVLIMSFLAPKEGHIASKTWLCAAGTVTQLKATSDFIAASRDMLPRLVAALEHEMEIGRRIEGGMSVSEEWLSEHHAELAAILTGDKP